MGNRQTKPLYIYNLFPKLYKNVSAWTKQISSIAGMGFNMIYINPFHYPGFSGSIYAPKEYYKFNPPFFSKTPSEEEQLKGFIDACAEKNVGVIMDLVINHTSIDSPLINEHKNWYVLENGDVKRPGAWENGKYVSWGDLATFDIKNSADRDGLWNYLLEVCRHYLKLGFKGFRCDAAYQIPNEFWEYLIATLRKDYPELIFIAETLGCTPVQIEILSNCGFDYIFNSSKWWNYNDPWCLEQYNMTRTIADSVSFPESHDTPRLMDEVHGNETAFLQRVYFEAIFSKGFMITSGMEYGFTKRINTVTSNPADWEDTGKDYRTNIKNILKVKDKLVPLHEESPITIVEQQNWGNVFCFCKEWDGKKVLVVFNKDINNEQHVYLNNVPGIINASAAKDYSPENPMKGNIVDLDISLKPGEIKIFAAK